MRRGIIRLAGLGALSPEAFSERLSSGAGSYDVQLCPG